MLTTLKSPLNAMDSIDRLNGKKMPLVATVEQLKVQLEPAEKPYN
jgi:hypothetical protein